MAAITDGKLWNDSLNGYLAEVVSAMDYEPFGLALDGRSLTGEEYRYGFNGKEDDGDFSFGIQDYGFRLYSRKIAKFLSVDPLAASYPWYTPYQFAGNKPIKFVDLDGLEESASEMEELAYAYGIMPDQWYYGIKDGVINLFAMSFESLVTDNYEGKLIRRRMAEKGYISPLSNEELGKMFELRQRNGNVSIEQDGGVIGNLQQTLISALSVLPLRSASPVTGFFAKVPTSMAMNSFIQKMGRIVPTTEIWKALTKYEGGFAGVMTFDGHIAFKATISEKTFNIKPPFNDVSIEIFGKKGQIGARGGSHQGLLEELHQSLGIPRRMTGNEPGYGFFTKFLKEENGITHIGVTFSSGSVNEKFGVNIDNTLILRPEFRQQVIEQLQGYFGNKFKFVDETPINPK